MPELPEVETTKRGITPHLLNHTIQQIIIRQPKLRWMVPDILKTFHDIKVKGLSRRAKYLIIHTEKGDIVGHLGMSGSLRVVDKDLAPSKHDHVDFVLSNGKILRYNDPRRFGAWLWAEKAEDLSVFKNLGPEPLDESFSGDYLFKQSRQRKMPVKGFLMHNAVVVGVGNIYANETLFLCHIHPQLPANQLSLEECHTLAKTIKAVLEKSIQQGGTTLKDFQQPDGKPGYFAQELLIYGKKGQPCPKCATPIENLVIGQRNSFFCPQCQKMPTESA